MIRVLSVLTLCATWPAAAAKIVEDSKYFDPRYSEKSQPIIFPAAEVKVVILEFDALAGDERGKERAKQLHNALLQQLNNVSGAAIVTLLSSPGQRIANYRVEAEEVAKRQGAKIALWGRVFADAKDRSMLAARISLVELPPGIDARYVRQVTGAENKATTVQGIINAPVTEPRIDFAPQENSVAALSKFLAGLVKYYKGAVRQGAEAAQWLEDSVSDFQAYVASDPKPVDAAASAQAHLYLSRALVRLADASVQNAGAQLAAASQHATTASRLNPYDASAPSILAVITERQNQPSAAVLTHLDEAVRLAPTDTTARLNLAVLNASVGHQDEALRTLEQAKHVQRVQRKPEPVDQRELEKNIRLSK